MISTTVTRSVLRPSKATSPLTSRSSSGDGASPTSSVSASVGSPSSEFENAVSNTPGVPSPPSPDTSTTATRPVAAAPPVIVRPGGYLEDQTAEQLEEDRRDLHTMGEPDCSSEQSRRSGNAEPERLAAQSIVQVEVVDVSRAPLQPPSASSDIPIPPPFDPALGIITKTSSSWQMKDLQPILGQFSGRFGLQFVPKLINLVGNLANGPWQLYGLNLPRAMEDIARRVWPELTGLIIEARQPFYELAKQKLSDYRNEVANKAVEVVCHFMRSRRFKNAPEARKEWVEWALSDERRYPFRYGEVTITAGGQQKRSGIYQGKLIVKTLAYHIKRIQMRADQIRDHPCNALALATTAVERAIRMWESGEFTPPAPRSEESKFSDKLWGPIAHDYLQSIINLGDTQWEKILQLAELHYRGLINDSDDEESEDDRGDYDPVNTRAASGRGSWDSEDDEDSTFEPLADVDGERMDHSSI
ncbi:hypothetical protein FKP32DRAFT_1671709 [Trametes sanguinea]|nr:hypothetical protein FKP32DRAFT_1671709 [Trametes sanguinea]